MTRPIEQTAPGKPSAFIDHEMRTWRLCLVCDLYQSTEDYPLSCPCGVEYGKTEQTAREQIEIPRQDYQRAVLCEDCGRGYSVPAKDWNPSADETCADCRKKQLMRALLQDQLRSAIQFGHTMPELECEICQIQNELDALTR